MLIKVDLGDGHLLKQVIHTNMLMDMEPEEMRSVLENEFLDLAQSAYEHMLVLTMSPGSTRIS